MPLFPIEPPQGHVDVSRIGVISANGSPFIVNAESPATVPVPLPVILAHVVGKYTERDRKLWRLLVHAAWDNLEKKRTHEISLRKIHDVFQAVGGDKNIDWIKESARRLRKTDVYYKITFGDPRFDREETRDGEVSFLSGMAVSTLGFLQYEIPEMLIDIIKRPLRFARIRTHFVIGLSGKHTITIYEILEAFANKKDPSFKVSVSEFRQWLNLSETQYSDWKNLKTWVIRPALEQINKDPEGAGFTVDFQTIKHGREITHLHFTLTKTDKRASLDDALVIAGDTSRRLRGGGNRPVLKPKTLQEAKRLYPRADIAVMERDWIEHWSNGMKPLKYPDAAFLGFAKTWAKRRDLS
jgi:Initiator Replication protein